MANLGQHDIDMAEKIGKLANGMETLLHRTDGMEKKLDGVVAMTNRWKGATTILILLGGAIGWASTFVLKFVGKA